MGESILKKEFRKSDIERVRNLVKKDFHSKTKANVGYDKAHKDRKEGDIWEENGKKWTIQDGIKRNITKLDKAKKMARVPLSCPKCKGTMKHGNDREMYFIHGICFNCTMDFEADLRKAGLFEKYEKQMIKGNIDAHSKDLKEWVNEVINTTETIVTERGDVEDWQSNKNQFKEQLLKRLDTYLEHVRNIYD